MMPYRGRFAPSPTGPLHFGSLVAALGSWLRARAAGGSWIVRIEDVDHARTVPGSANRIVDTLRACGLESDAPVVHQSQRGALYAAALERLRDSGHAYPCACSRSDLASLRGIHPSSCLRPASEAKRHAWRVRVPDQTIRFDDLVFGKTAQSMRAEVGDFVVRRLDGDFAYQLAVVVDDADQHVSEVVRGADLLDSTPRQILLRRLLGFAETAWLHLPLVLDAQGRKLGKSDHAHPVDAADPLPALRAALRFLGQSVPATPHLGRFLAAAAETFDVTRIPRRDPPHAATQKD